MDLDGLGRRRNATGRAGWGVVETTSSDKNTGKLQRRRRGRDNEGEEGKEVGDDFQFG